MPGTAINSQRSSPAGTYDGVGLFSLRSLVCTKAGENTRRAAL